MHIRLVESIRLRSVEHAAGAVLDVSERDAAELIAAGQAEAVKPVKPVKSVPTPPEQE